MFDPAFTSLNEFLAMGRYGFYVWLSYGLAFVVLAGNILFYFINRKHVLRDLLRAQKRQLKQEQQAAVSLKKVHKEISGE
jgi:heme exporter protein D